MRCALSNASTKALEKWITASGKKFTDYLFPGRGVEGPNPMGQRQLNRLLKLWVVEAGLDPSDYSVKSLRRTKALHIFERHWRFADSSSAPRNNDILPTNTWSKDGSTIVSTRGAARPC